MANEEHLEILKQGVEVWNKWREDNPDIRPDLSDADLEGADLSGADLREANLGGANLSEAGLRGANLRGADLEDAYLNDADLSQANLSGANLRNADFIDANLRGADLRDANLYIAILGNADLSDANLANANVGLTFLMGTKLAQTNFEGAVLFGASFSDVDLSVAVGLDKVRHDGPSSLGIDTLYKSGGMIPAEFLRGCGLPEDCITHFPSIIGALEPIQFYSCFISYSTKDEEFARRLYSRMRDEKLRVWFAPEEMKGGKLLHEQIEQAIQIHDRLLIILSEESMKSEWVKREIRNARRAEKKEDHRKLFPIRLVDYDAIENWKGFEGDGAEDLAFELGKFYIPDFSNWKDHDSFEKEFEKLLRDLRAEEKRQAGDRS
jgi:hypothetical protein